MLTIIEELKERDKERRIVYLCKCHCGNITTATGKSIRLGLKTSCGCKQKEFVSKLKYKHGLSKHPMFSMWMAMKQRCYNPNHHKYPDYGGRGIYICEEWKESFPKFLEDMGERPEGMTIDRMDNSKGYYKENCQWATPTQQANNRRERGPLRRKNCS